VLVEKPMAATVEEADAMIAAARRAGVLLQVGQVERFNPAFLAARPHVRRPMFIEAHRLAVFQPRSLDVDVVFDLMIHDLDLVLHAVGVPPAQLSAVGVAVLSSSEDIANARLEFEDGCVANLTASRVSQERLRRIRFFQGDAYLSIDLSEKTGELLKLDLSRLRPEAPLEAIQRASLPVAPGEPLALELAAFTRSCRGDGAGAATAEEGRAALRIAAEVRAAMQRRTAQWAARSSVVS
jgi:predicted dehydrogenase